MKEIKAFLFDLDGTLIDSELFHFECWNEILGDHKLELTFEDWLKNYAGFPLPTNARNLIEKYRLNVDFNEFVSKREALTLMRLKTKDVKLMPYALEFVEYFHEMGIIMAIVTSSPRTDVEATLERNGLKDYFTTIITRSDVNNNKPHPESYIIGYEKLGINKDFCLAFEDTINGSKSAVSAGIECLAIQSDDGNRKNLSSIANHTFPSFKEAKTFICENHRLP